MKIWIERFRANNHDLTFDDVIQNVRMGKTKEGVVNIHFDTVAKYIEVDANGSCHGPDYSGQMVTLVPYLYDENGNALERVDDAFYEHPDFWICSLVVDIGNAGSYWNSNVIALKHEYFLSYIPDDMVMNYDCLQEAEMIEIVDEE